MIMCPYMHVRMGICACLHESVSIFNCLCDEYVYLNIYCKQETFTGLLQYPQYMDFHGNTFAVQGQGPIYVYT